MEKTSEHPFDESYLLPNKMVIAHLNKYETDYLYKEIFEEKVYLRHGIMIREGDCIFDVGANIGMFSLFVQFVARNTRIFAFEPSPLVFDILRNNLHFYGSNVELYNCGLSDVDGEKLFTFYLHSSVFSGYYADLARDKDTIQSVITTQLREILGETASLHNYVEQLMEGRLEKETFLCPIRTLSSIIRDHQIQYIDLLKVDVEKSELAVLKGIDPDDWKKIKQIVMEIHDQETLQLISNILKEHKFNLFVDQEAPLERADFYNLYGKNQLSL